MVIYPPGSKLGYSHSIIIDNNYNTCIKIRFKTIYKLKVTLTIK